MIPREAVEKNPSLWHWILRFVLVILFYERTIRGSQRHRLTTALNAAASSSERAGNRHELMMIDGCCRHHSSHLGCRVPNLLYRTKYIELPTRQFSISNMCSMPRFLFPENGMKYWNLETTRLRIVRTFEHLIMKVSTWQRWLAPTYTALAPVSSSCFWFCRKFYGWWW